MDNGMLLRWIRGYAKTAGTLVFVIGATVLSGWVLNISLFKSILSVWPEMAVSTAACFVLSGAALLAASVLVRTPTVTRTETFNSVFKWLLCGCAGITVLLALLRLCAHLMNWHSGLDQLWLFTPDTSNGTSPARMSPATALDFLLAGFALLLARQSKHLILFEGSVLLAGLVGWLGFSHYLYGGEPLLPYSDMAVHTSLAFLILSSEILCSRMDGGLMALIATNSLGGMIARRLVPAVLFFPIIFGWLRLAAQRHGWFGTEAGISLFAVANITVFGGLIWASAAKLHRSDTQRRQAEATNLRLAAIVESSDDAIISKTLDGAIITSWNSGAEKMFGYSAKEAIGRPMLILFPPARVNEEADIIARIKRGESIDHFETVRVKKDGSQIDLSVTISPIRDEKGNIVGASKIARDITERKLAETKLRAQLGRLNLLHQITRAIGERQDLDSILQVVIRSLEENLPIDFGCVCTYDQTANSVKVVRVGIKSAALAMELAMAEEAEIPIDQNGLSRSVQGQLVYEPDINQVQFPFPQRLARGGLRSLVVAPLQVESQVFGVLIAARQTPRSFSSGECEFLKQLSEHVALSSHQSQIYTALQRAYDDLRQTQQAVMQQERLKALGQMASGIAHDINNAVSPAMLYVEWLKENEPNISDESRKHLQTITHAIDDVAATVARMTEFYRQREPQLVLVPVQLNQLIQQVIDLTRARWSDMPQQRGIVIDTETSLADNLPPVMGVESEIREALINLVFNAVDAMPDGGTLMLRTNVAANGSTLRTVRVEVVDSGCGMDEDTRRRCLEPFFTTKGERGTGLGLAMVFGIAQRHKAEIEIESAVGKGTTIRLGFNAPATVAAGPARPAMATAVASRQRILVVDDDPLLIKSLRDILETDGHLVVTANGGDAGIMAFRSAQERKEPFSVVITDLGMPYVDGRKVASAIKQASPSTPVILLTGWGQRLTSESDVPAHVDRVLNKPPKLRDVREALAECCQSATS
jgi:PAS domain S-box-containing protein